MTEPRALTPARIVCAGILLSWLWKSSFFVHAVSVYRDLPLHDDFFPAPLQHLSWLVLAFCVPAAVGCGLLLRPRRGLALVSMLAFACGSLVLCLHQGSYNDATFVTSLWASLWGLWLVHESQRAAPELAARAAFLAQAIVALTFFGGVLGKLTPGYFDGSVLYRIYFEKRQHWSFAWLRAHLDASDVRYAALLYSRAVLGIEASLATLPLWPSRPALIFACAALGMLVLLNNFLLLSVVGSLLALCLAGLWLLRPTHARPSELTSSPNAAALV